jgi:hypothetical protein
MDINLEITIEVKFEIYLPSFSSKSRQYVIMEALEKEFPNIRINICSGEYPEHTNITGRIPASEIINKVELETKLESVIKSI